MGNEMTAPKTLHAIDYLVNFAQGGKPDGTLTTQEVQSFCDTELPTTSECDPCGETVVAFKKQFCGAQRPTETRTYWAGVKDSSGRIYQVTDSSLKEDLIAADFTMGDGNSTTSVKEIAAYRLEIGVVHCSMNFSQHKGDVTSISGECIFDGNTSECKPFDAALRAISSDLLSEVAQKTDESLNFFRDSLRSMIPQGRTTK